ncbi:MAG: PDDEXK nuclease domain-containing protein [Candidatus Obscuribacterales bacterium]|nr:PDDEXK nuclease domain-containing protein [Candidatus Obscuribacterales bacterium]
MKKKLAANHANKSAKMTHPGNGKLFDRVVSILEQARNNVVRVVNSNMVIAYWLIGREIVQELQAGETRAGYGKTIIEDLAKRLAERYGQGFSSPNLRNFRQFYLLYKNRIREIGHTLCDELSNARKSYPLGSELSKEQKSYTPCSFLNHGFHPCLSWSHYRALMRVEKENARDFYEEESVTCGWSVRELERQINSSYYERLLASKDKKGMLQNKRRAKQQLSAEDVLKSPTVLEFLNLRDNPQLHESDLEQAIIDNLQSFLLELGKGFAFVARQQRLQFDDEDFYVDLVFYNILLKCFVLIDLKIGKLTHQDIGQMDGYVRMYEDLHKVKGDNPTIGLVLCAQKNEAVAKYSVLKESKQLFASRYMLYLPTEEQLVQELRREQQLLQDRLIDTQSAAEVKTKTHKKKSR